jgi:hypothetical protein
MWELVSILVALWLFVASAGANAQTNIGRWKEVVEKISHRQGFFLKFGTGWCFDPDCYFVVTNYHVVKLVGSDLRIRGVEVRESYPATGENDEGARWIKTVAGLHLRYNPVRDIAILRVQRPLSQKGMHGVAPYAGQLQPGQEATVYGYPRGKALTGAPGRFVRELRDGVLLFEMQTLEAGRILQGGISGGLIVDRQDRAVGLLCGISGEHAFAVPMWSVADVVKRIEPGLYTALLPRGIYRPTNPISADLEAESELTDPDVETPTGGLSPEAALAGSYLRYGLDEGAAPGRESSALSLTTRTGESTEVRTLRGNAQRMVEGMKNFIAVQTLYLSDGARTAVWQHEVRVVYGQQTFRKWPDGREEFSELPYPKQGIVPGGEWTALPSMVGTDLKLKIEPAGELAVGEHKVKVFRYQAAPEDDACALRTRRSYGLWHKDWRSTMPCRGEVWTDEHFEILRISQDLEVPRGQTFLQQLQIAVMYGWLERPGLKRELVPVEIFLQGQFTNGAMYYCTGRFTNYRVFATSTRLESFPEVDTHPDMQNR